MLKNLLTKKNIKETKNNYCSLQSDATTEKGIRKVAATEETDTDSFFEERLGSSKQ